MLIKTFEQASSNVVALNRILLIVVGLMVPVSFYNYKLATSLKDEQRTVILTPTMLTENALIITGTDANNQYLRKMARDIMNLFLNYTPATISSQYEELVRLYHPDTYDVERAALMNLKDRVRKSLRITSGFVPTDYIKMKKGVLRVVGIRTRISKDKVLKNTEKKYKIEYKITNGKFYLLRIREA